MRISDWSSDVCSSDLHAIAHNVRYDHSNSFPRLVGKEGGSRFANNRIDDGEIRARQKLIFIGQTGCDNPRTAALGRLAKCPAWLRMPCASGAAVSADGIGVAQFRGSEEQTSEVQSLM